MILKVGRCSKQYNVLNAIRGSGSATAVADFGVKAAASFDDFPKTNFYHKMSGEHTNGA